MDEYIGRESFEAGSYYIHSAKSVLVPPGVRFNNVPLTPPKKKSVSTERPHNYMYSQGHIWRHPDGIKELDQKRGHEARLPSEKRGIFRLTYITFTAAVGVPPPPPQEVHVLTLNLPQDLGVFPSGNWGHYSKRDIGSPELGEL